MDYGVSKQTSFIYIMKWFVIKLIADAICPGEIAYFIPFLRTFLILESDKLFASLL